MAKRSLSFQYFDVARLWDVERCRELACFDDCDQVLYSPDGKTFATGHRDHTIRLWDVPPRKPVLAILGVSLVLWFGLIVGAQLWTRLLRRGRAPRNGLPVFQPVNGNAATSAG
jgi:WD40 repeat protein